MTFSCKSFLVSFASFEAQGKILSRKRCSTAIIVEMRYGHLEPSFMISILQLIFPLQKFLQFAPIFVRFSLLFNKNLILLGKVFFVWLAKQVNKYLPKSGEFLVCKNCK